MPEKAGFLIVCRKTEFLIFALKDKEISLQKCREPRAGMDSFKKIKKISANIEKNQIKKVFSEKS